MRTNVMSIGKSGMFLLGALLLWGCGDPDTPADVEVTAQGASAPVASVKSQSAETAMSAGGYAPKLVMPGKRPDHVEVPLTAMVLESARIPPESEVNIPAYPGARIMSTMAGGTMSSDGKKVKSLPAMILLANDGLETVLAFYEEQLSDWQYQEMYGNHMFWNGPEGSNPLDIMAGHSAVTLSAIEETEVQRLLWPEVRTRIDIAYDKPRQ